MSAPESAIRVRPATPADQVGIWRVLGPIIAAGETYPLPRDWGQNDATSYWFSPAHTVFVAELGDQVVGTYYIRPNNQGGGAHIANCGYMVSMTAQGRGIARTMCAHSLDQARRMHYQGMQFNFVIASNERAVRLWTAMGFQTIGRLPKVFDHPRLGYVDALVMFQALSD